MPAAGARGSQASAARTASASARRARIAGEQLEQRGQLRAAADAAQDERRAAGRAA